MEKREKKNVQLNDNNNNEYSCEINIKIKLKCNNFINSVQSLVEWRRHHENYIELIHVSMSMLFFPLVFLCFFFVLFRFSFNKNTFAKLKRNRDNNEKIELLYDYVEPYQHWKWREH